MLEKHLKDLKEAPERNVETEAVIIRDILFKVFPELEAAFNTGDVFSPATPAISGEDESKDEPVGTALPPAEAMTVADDDRDEPMSDVELKEYLHSRLPVWSPIDVWEIFKKPSVEEFLLRYVVDQMPDEVSATTSNSSYTDYVVGLLFSGGYLADHSIPKMDEVSFPFSAMGPSFPAVPNKFLRFLNMLALASENTAKEAGNTFDQETFWRQLRQHFAGGPVPTVGKPSAKNLISSARATVAAEIQQAVSPSGEIDVEQVAGQEHAAGEGGEVVVAPAGNQLNLRSRIVHARSALNESYIVSGDGRLQRRERKRSSSKTETTETESASKKKK